MNDCFWAMIDVCGVPEVDGRGCRECARYASVNSDKQGVELYEKFEQEVEQALAPLEEKYKHMFGELCKEAK